MNLTLLKMQNPNGIGDSGCALVAKVEIFGYKNQGGQEPNPPALFPPKKKQTHTSHGTIETLGICFSYCHRAWEYLQTQGTS